MSFVENRGIGQQSPGTVFVPMPTTKSGSMGEHGGVTVDKQPSSLSGSAQQGIGGSVGKSSLDSRTIAKDQSPGNERIARDAQFGALPSKDQLISSAGSPKKDLFFGLWKMSTGYKS